MKCQTCGHKRESHRRTEFGISYDLCDECAGYMVPSSVWSHAFVPPAPKERSDRPAEGRRGEGGT